MPILSVLIAGVSDIFMGLNLPVIIAGAVITSLVGGLVGKLVHKVR